MSPLGSETVTVKPDLQYDPVGNPIQGTDDSYEIKGCAVYPIGTSEADYRSSTVTENLILLAPVEESTLDSGLAVVRRGRTYSIDGEPQPHVFLDGTLAGTQVTLRRER